MYEIPRFLDDTLDFKDHIKRECQAAMLNYFKIKSIRKYLTREDTEVLSVISYFSRRLLQCDLIRHFPN